ncbi:S1 family peptidase [Alkalicoccus daliensis]|uniref:Serine protease Do n=1 Tax=Alkalicoccus daliensis TaxID=745820 RepID=A0A1H0ANB6_9BACI|nr:serine protease [Alkalicoccus daliensis]SDN34879.1 serine protease Do [Alkalicoccus daliensis]
MSDYNKDDDKNQDLKDKKPEDLEEKKESEEELFFDGENYLTKEEFFNPPEEEKLENQKPKKTKRFFKVIIASVVTVALLANVFAVWPQLFNFPAAEFLENARELSDNEEVQSYKESIVVVRTEDSKGTGFVFDEGRIMTNEHVIRDGAEITVHFENGDSYFAEVEDESEELDIALLTVDSDDFSHPELSLSTAWTENEDIVVIGNPLFFNYIANRGMILEHVSINSKPSDVIALEAPIYRGSSGSPVINEDGEVTGVIYATSNIQFDTESQRVGLAIDMEDILEGFEELN